MDLLRVPEDSIREANLQIGIFGWLACLHSDFPIASESTLDVLHLEKMDGDCWPAIVGQDFGQHLCKSSVEVDAGDAEFLCICETLFYFTGQLDCSKLECEV